MCLIEINISTLISKMDQKLEVHGILLQYEDTPFLATDEYTVTISHSSFMFNYNMNRNFTAAGLTIFYLQKTYNASVVVDTSSFCKNNAYTSGGLLILQEHITSKTVE